MSKAHLVIFIAVLLLFQSSLAFGAIVNGGGPTVDTPPRAASTRGTDNCRANGSTPGNGTGVPSAPENLTYTVTMETTDWGSAYVSTMFVMWDPPKDDGGSPVTEYLIMAGYCDCNLSQINSTPAHQTDYGGSQQNWNWDVSWLVWYGYTLYFQVIAVNAAGNSTPCAMIGFEVPEYGSPDYIETESDPGTGHIIIRWREPEYDNTEAPLWYNVYRLYPDYPEWRSAFVANVSYGVNLAIDTEAPYGEWYLYRVEAVYADGITAFDQTWEEVLLSPWVDEALNGTAGYGYVQLHWEEPVVRPGMTLTGYRVWRSEYDSWYRWDLTWDSPTLADIDDRLIMFELDASQTSYNDTDVEGEEDYYYIVTAECGVDGSFPSNIVEFEPRYGVPSFIDRYYYGVDANDGEDPYIDLNWRDARADPRYPVTGYRVYRGTDPDELKLIAEVPPEKNRYKDTDVKHGRTYYYKITAVNELGEGEPDRIIDVYLEKEEPFSFDPFVCCGVIVGSSIVLAIFLTGYVVGGRREVKKYRKEHEDGKKPEHGGKGGPDRPVVFRRKRAGPPRPLMIPGRPPS